MSNSEIQGTKLVELYHRYVGEPESKRDVYGYWLFLLGSIAGMAGVAVFQVEQLLFAGNFQVRESAIVLAAAGLTVTMFGVVVLLPVRQRGMQVSVIGFLVAALGIGGFVWAYPQAWDVQPDYSAPIIAVYSVGLAVIAGVAVLVPVVTGEKGAVRRAGVGNRQRRADAGPRRCGVDGQLPEGGSADRRRGRDTRRGVRRVRGGRPLGVATRGRRSPAHRHRAGRLRGRRGRGDATATFAGRIDDPRVLALSDLGVELFELDGTWRWRLIDEDGQVRR
jgi:hypothetical protein